MAWFNSFYDTSGPTHAGGAVVTSGTIASAQKWSGVERKWLDRLAIDGIDHLHMAELLDHFSGDRRAVDRLVVDLAKLIRPITGKFMICVDAKHFQRIDARYQVREVWGSPFTLAAGLCAMLVEEWIMETHPDQPRRHWHEDGDARADQDRLRGILANRGVVMNFEPKADTTTGRWWVPFQINDLLAVEQRRAYEGITRKRKGWEPSQALMDILRGMRVARVLIDIDAINDMAPRYPELFPARD